MRTIAVALLLVPVPAWAQGALWYPGRDEYGFVLFEDQWPNAGDNDFNDLVLGYNYRVASDVTQVTGLTATYDVRALGASNCLGLGLHLPTTAPVTVSLARGTPGSADGAPWEALPAPEAGADADAVWFLVDDLRGTLCGGAEGFLNTDPSEATVDCAPLRVEVAFAANPSLPVDPPWDPFVYRCDDRGHQLHRPSYPGTAAANPALFGTGADDPSHPYQHLGPTAGLPWVLVIGEDPGGHPVERARVDVAWPTIVTFAANPAQGTDYYADGAVRGDYVFGDEAGGTLPSDPIVPLAASDDDFDGWCEGWVAGDDAVADDCLGAASAGDCDDALSTRSPGRAEVWYDGLDADCGFDDDYDQDHDGFRVYPGAPGGTGRDCADTNGSLLRCGQDAATARASCAEILKIVPEFQNTDAVYYVKPQGTTAIPVWCDMTLDGGGWTLVAHVADPSDTTAHRTQAAAGTPTFLHQLHTTGSYAAGYTGKLSDADINGLRGPYSTSVIRMQSRTGAYDYFRENKAFNAVAGTASINTVYNTWSAVQSQSGACSGIYNGSIHTGLVGWGCYDYMLYGDNSGFRVNGYIGGEVYVKQLNP